MALGRRQVLRVFLLILVSGMMVALAVAVVALASHPVPANTGALKKETSLVQAMNQCTTPNSQHASPLSAPSCVPPVATSPLLRIGTKATAPPGKDTSAWIEVFCTNLDDPPCLQSAGDQQDILLEVRLRDIRCVSSGSTPNCANPNAGVDTRPDYNGQLQVSQTIRITDANNTSPGFTTHGTVIDLPFPVTIQCVNTGGTGTTTIGGQCNVKTTYDAIVPNFVRESKKASIELGQLQVTDGGADGVASTAPNNLFLREGVYAP